MAGLLNVASTWSGIRMLVTDFDGVHTSDAVYVDQDGRETVRCLRADGYGISKLKAAGIPVYVVSAEVNPVVTARCRKLDIRCEQGLENKAKTLRNIIVTSGLSSREVCYIGNDINDLDCLRMVGHPVVVGTAEAELFDALGISPYSGEFRGPFYITTRAGGYGAVREVCDLILKERR